MIKTCLLKPLKDPFIAAASGLTIIGETFYTVSDDENGIFCFPENGSGSFINVFDGDLPSESKARKKMKPDFEAIVALNENQLLCLPSGSKPNRIRGAIIQTDGEVSKLEFKNTYERLLTDFPELNIEGAVINEQKLILFQRGNGKLHQNGVITLDLEAFLKDEISDLEIYRPELGHFKEVPLSFTDATLHNGNIFFTAVAERTESTYFDGEYAGAVLGIMNMNFEILKTFVIDIPSKPEGIAIKDGTIYFVTDDDDRSKASGLFSAELSAALF